MVAGWQLPCWTTLILAAQNGETKRTLEQPSPVECVRFSPDAKVLATASADGLVKLWEVENGAELATLRGHRGPAECLAFSHDGKRLASGGADRTIRIWDTEIRQTNAYSLASLEYSRCRFHIRRPVVDGIRLYESVVDRCQNESCH